MRILTEALDNFVTGYRRIFSVIFLSNLAVLIALIVQNNGTPKAEEVATAASCNLMVTLLFRQENFVNLLYEIAVCVPHATPLWIRRRLALVFHYGGGHSGAGVAGKPAHLLLFQMLEYVEYRLTYCFIAVTWYLLYTAIATKDFIESRDPDQIPNVVTSAILLTMFLVILGSAYPTFRVRFHDHFEAFHRFAGWVCLVTFWVHIVTAAKVYAKAADQSLGMHLVKSVSFWTFLISTSCSIASWSRLRLRDVYPETLSDHAIRLHFKYKKMQPFYGLKVSNKPLTEWHAFATIPDDDGNGNITGFSIVVSNAGDWTNKTINEPPKKLWIRGYPLHGLLYTSTLFKKIVIVATGSGIGPCLSLMYAKKTPCRILWSTPHPETTYGPNIVSTVQKADPQAIIWNTRTQGRPDMVAMTWALVQECGAEAVFIISNPKVTKKVVYGMKTRGVAAYGAIFDS
jgi:NAD(P)H-flavin reductase